MKTVMVVCGSGVATSTLVTAKIREFLTSQGISDQVKLLQGNIAEHLNDVAAYDAFVSSTVVPEELKDQVISGIPLLIGMAEEEVYQAILRKLALSE